MRDTKKTNSLVYIPATINGRVLTIGLVGLANKEKDFDELDVGIAGSLWNWPPFP